MSAIGIVTMNHIQVLHAQILDEQFYAVRQQLRDLPGAEGCHTWWVTAPEMGFLETTDTMFSGLEQTRLHFCAGKLSRDMQILHAADGCYLICEDRPIVPFLSDDDAWDFVNAIYSTSGLLL
jgi:hypothetical protein